MPSSTRGHRDETPPVNQERGASTRPRTRRVPTSDPSLSVCCLGGRGRWRAAPAAEPQTCAHARLSSCVAPTSPGAGAIHAAQVKARPPAERPPSFTTAPRAWPKAQRSMAQSSVLGKLTLTTGIKIEVHETECRGGEREEDVGVWSPRRQQSGEASWRRRGPHEAPNGGFGREAAAFMGRRAAGTVGSEDTGSHGRRGLSTPRLHAPATPWVVGSRPAPAGGAHVPDTRLLISDPTRGGWVPFPDRLPRAGHPGESASSTFTTSLGGQYR